MPHDRQSDIIRLYHIRDAAKEVLMFAAQTSKELLPVNRHYLLAIVKSLEMIGEAAGKVSPEVQKLGPQIPWRSMIGMRNRLIHSYFDINLEILWQTVENDVPTVLEQVEKLIAEI